MHAELALALICIPRAADDDNKLSDELTSERLNSTLQRRVVYYLHVRIAAAIVESPLGWHGAQACSQADWLNRIDKPMWSALFQEGACMREQLFEGERV